MTDIMLALGFLVIDHKDEKITKNLEFFKAHLSIHSRARFVLVHDITFCLQTPEKYDLQILVKTTSLSKRPIAIAIGEILELFRKLFCSSLT
jgi:hypothetical protein